MKKRPWLDVLENASLVGLGVGSVASLMFKQLFYTTAPLSLLVIFSLLNRRQFEQQSEQERKASLNNLDRRFSKQVELLTHRVEQLPTPETIQRLKKGFLQKNREVAGHLYAEMASVQDKFNKRLAPLEQQKLQTVRQDFAELNEKYNHLLDGLAQLNADIGQIQSSDSRQISQLDRLVAQLRNEVTAIHGDLDNLTQHTKTNLSAFQEQVTRFDRNLSKLPPPIDISSLKQEVAELVKVIADLVPKRDLTALANNLQTLYQEQEVLKQSVSAIETAAVNFKRSFNTLSTPSETTLAPLPGTALEAEFSALFDQQLLEAANSAQGWQDSVPAVPPSRLYPDLHDLATNYLNHLQMQLVTIQEVTEQLAQQQQQLQTQIHHLPQTLDVVALQQQIKDLSRRILSPESTFNAFKARIYEVLQQELHSISQQLQAIPATPQHELLFDLSTDRSTDHQTITAGSRAILEAALTETQSRLILVYPWSEQCSLGDDLMDQLENFLRQGRKLDLGWCHLVDRSEERLIGKVKRGWMNQLGQTELQKTLHQLLQLKRSYPDHFQFKVLGTTENFLISDHTFAVLGITDSLKTTAAFSELQLKLRTRDPEVIERLIDRFDYPTLVDDDLAGYWNRAVTRYDLGDKAGALEDYNHILTVQPNDAITYNYQGIAQFDLGNMDAAMLDFTHSVQCHPHQSAAYINRGFIRSEQGDPWGAINDYTLAIQADPDCAIAYFYRGLAWQKQEDHREAINNFTDAIRLTPDSPVAYFYRGLAWQKLGQPEAAIEDLEIAADRFASRGSKTNAQKALKSLAKLRQEVLEAETVAQAAVQPSSFCHTETIDQLGQDSQAETNGNGHHHYHAALDFTNITTSASNSSGLNSSAEFDAAPPTTTDRSTAAETIESFFAAPSTELDETPTVAYSYPQTEAVYPTSHNDAHPSVLPSNLEHRSTSPEEIFPNRTEAETLADFSDRFQV
ncbi:MAG TPA: tetratricopeptide repeat protein [Trichocoleus sp.]|jgi:tetratricopeptide (TPR) repeat protein